MNKKLLGYILLIILVLTRIIFLNKDVKPQYSFEPIEGLLAYDRSDINEVVKHSSHIFVGKIISQNNTYETDFELPLTSYTVEVIEGMKGDLEEASYIEIFKEGGKLTSKNIIMFHENDGYLVTGSYYILLGAKQDEDIETFYKGTLILNGPEDNILLDANTVNALDQSGLYMSCIEAIISEKYGLEDPNK